MCNPHPQRCFFFFVPTLSLYFVPSHVCAIYQQAGGVLGGDRAEHGWEEQHCEDGGPHVHYGTGKTAVPHDKQTSVSPITSDESVVELVECPNNDSIDG